MIRNKKSLLIKGMLLALCAGSAHAQAEQSCELTSNNTDETKRYIQCLDQVIADLHRDQKMWINKLTMDLEKIKEDSGNSQLLPIFNRSVKNQERYLEDSCRWRYLQKMPNGTKAAIVYKQCEIEILKNHIQVLQRPLK
ncbi:MULTISPECIES: hypothetical protein [Pseudoalteromonas]|uniref:DUF1311 domain-containing protein n=1 Tax=Pseudoalteromonas gelatinilytica TaxID=1703256 RepID=A0A3A3ER85_9GAMM|nr:MULTISPECIES: hypothetical protein [Pseudoalteromonas]RJF36521.1 hypothetical protein D4741_00110 [Pseudoalteromonas profundi]TMO30463.1 hypothetical protein CWC28_03640 [Pseudoalteromonas sp. S4492]